MARRSRRPAAAPPAPDELGAPTAAGRSVEFTRLLASKESLTELLPYLHQRAIQAAGAVCSVLFESDSRADHLRPTSAFRLDQHSVEAWQPLDAEARAIADHAHRTAQPTVISRLERQMPSLARRLGTAVGLFVPLGRPEKRLGLLVLGLGEPPRLDVGAAVGAVADAFALALERAQLQRTATMQRGVRELVLAFSRGVSSALNVAMGLEVLSQEANRLFAAVRTSIWLHERRKRQLVLVASSDVTIGARGTRVATDDDTWPAVRGMRRPCAELAVGSSEDRAALPSLVVPLRGRRRALGTIVFEGVRTDDGGGSGLLDFADELGRQLSGALENVQLLEEVIRSHRKLENTFNSIADLVAVWDQRLCLAHVNQAFANRVGSASESILDRPLMDFVGPDTGEWIAQLDPRSGSGSPSPVTRELSDPVLKGTFSITLTRLINYAGEPIGGVMVARDITEQARLEAERATLRERLAQSEKLAALGQFVAGIAHELNNPLQGVLGHIELLKTTGAVPRALQREFKTVSREAERAAKIVRSLLIFAGSRRLVRRRLSLNTLVSRALALRSEACRAAGIEIIRRYDEAMPRMSGDSLRLQQALLNILINAEHAAAAEGGGRIEVSTSFDATRRVAVARVRDTGKGIAADVLPRIFEPFYTTKDVGQGTGLGLTITYGIIQEHAGHILAGNHRDGGAVITIELPVDGVMIK